MYLYLDAAYLRRALANRLTEVGIPSASPRWPVVAKYFRATRTYFYDCPETVRREAEDEIEYHARTRAQDAQSREIGLLDGFFVRRGSHRGTPGRTRQKEVDVLLAVDMLTHAQRQTTKSVTLLAGDLDFKPVVEAVVELGVTVTVAFEPRSGSVDLALAADMRQKISLFDLWHMSDQYVQPRGRLLLPTSHHGKGYEFGQRLERAMTEVGPIYFRKAEGPWVLDFEELSGLRSAPYWSSQDQDLLRAWVEGDFGSVTWQDDWPERDA